MSRDIDTSDPRHGFDDDDRRGDLDRDPPDPARGGRSDAEGRDAVSPDPREVFTRDLHVPQGPEREHYDLRERSYDLRASEVRTMATAGAFRVVPAHDLRDHDGRALDTHRGDLRHLRDAGLVRTVPHVLNGERTTLVTLTRTGRDLLQAHQERHGRDAPQRFYSGLAKPRELAHDAHVYRAYLRTAERLAEQGARVHRVTLDYELKSEYQRFLQEGNRDRADSDGRPTRDAREIDDWAFDHHLPAEDGHVQFPDVRIEYELPDGRREIEDVEVMTAHYRGAHASAKGGAGFTQYRAATGAGRSRGGGGQRPWGGAIRSACSGKAAAMTTDTRVQAVIDCGFTSGQARFLVAVMLHAGVCIARQYGDAAQLAHGQQMHDFFRRLVESRWARMYPCPDRRGHLYHVHGLRPYRAIGAPLHRHRRIGSLGRAVERLMLLDAILMAPDVSWCGTVEEQRAHLVALCDPDAAGHAVSPLDKVLRTRPGHAGAHPPIGVRDRDDAVVWLYLVTTDVPTRFRAFVRQHIALLRLLPRWTIRLVCPAHFAAAADAYRAAFHHELGTSSGARDASLECVILTHRYHALAPLVGTA